ncbi:MAG: exopolysaccharide biosynthesis polyprenyl glycosylphosphotransferase [Cytophagaceae bacterium]|nr:exopolysaccharide biosynthesis polyprenyl glycosylphosphotransferase [Cytophagaceae bacterium]
MRSGQRFLGAFLLLLADVACFGLTYFLVDLFQAYFPSHGPRFMEHHNFWVNASIWGVVALYLGVYRAYVEYQLDVLMRQTWRALVFQQLIVAFFLKLNTGHFYFEQVIFIKVGLLFFFIFAVRFLLLRIDYIIENRSNHFNRIGIYGLNLDAIQLASQFEMQYHGRKFAGIINEEKVLSRSDDDLPMYIQVLRAIDYAQEVNIRELFVCVPTHYIHDLNYLFQEAEKKFVRLNIVPSAKDQRRWAYPVQQELGIHFITNRVKPLDSLANRMIKRGFDIVFSLLVIVLVLSWLYPILAVIIKLQSKGPVIFKQQRTGRGNMVFWCYKFRSMRVNDASDRVQAVKDDVRLTRIGAFIRKTSLDEFPQFINVLLGDMSVVGPRPHMLYHSQTYQRLVEGFTFRHFVKPGITGLAQISGLRGEVNGPEILQARIQKDIEYIEHWNLIQDVKICFLTIYFLVMGDDNAY